jgi:hypothetical protein
LLLFPPNDGEKSLVPIDSLKVNYKNVEIVPIPAPR